ncbi:MAG: hypothetical protein KF841_11445 [Phycisphaerae bacterium]|nr:hypothetical protein [Phycisphaerae bacterium]
MQHRRIRTVSLGLLQAWALLSTRGLASARAQEPCPEHLPGLTIATIQSGDITEASGLAASRNSPGILWTHNDNYNDQRLFAIGQDGIVRATWTLEIPSPVIDPEDLDIGPGPVAGVDYLYFGDIGDNNSQRASIRVLRAPEPIVAYGQLGVSGSIPADVITLTYPDGPRDAESLLVDANGDLYIVAKKVTPGRVYRCPFPQSTTQVNLLQEVGQLNGWNTTPPTGGSISFDGSAIIIRGYYRISMWTRARGDSIAAALARPPCDRPIVWEQQGEAVCFFPQGLGYFTVSEGSAQPIHYFPRLLTCTSNEQCDDGDPCTIDICDNIGCAHLPDFNDADGDTIPDCLDLCPDSPAGQPVDEFGCPMFSGNRIGQLISALLADELDHDLIERFDRNADGLVNAIDMAIIIRELLNN